MTDLTKGSKASKTAEEGAEAILYLVRMEREIKEGMQGEFFKEGVLTKID